MNRKAEADSNEDPYELIRKLRTVITSQKQTIEEYEMTCESLEAQKGAAFNEIAQMRRQLDYLTKKIEQEKLAKSMVTLDPTHSQDLFMFRPLSKESKQPSIVMSSPLRKSDISNSHLTLLGSPSDSHIKKQPKSKEFIPSEVSFNKKRQPNLPSNSILNDSLSETGHQLIGEYLIEDFMVIGPDIGELKRLREEQREEKELRIQEYSYFNLNKIYSSKKAEYLKDIAQRSFPLGAQANRKTVDNIEQFKGQMQFLASPKMCQDFFIFNLKGDFNEPPHNQKTFLGNCNAFRALYVICLRVPDFIPIRDEKYYQRREQQVWMVQKVYAILTYFPFLQIHLALLSKIHTLLQPHWHALHREEIFTRNLTRNLADAQKNEELSRLLNYFMTRKPDYNQVCELEKDYFGTLPNFGFSAEYAIAKFACPIFFSIFAYEEMLLLLTALFLQKSIIFASKSESAATLCALFLVTVISPFVYNQHLILNCNNQMVENLVFGFPLTLVASLKKPSNFTNILSEFIRNNTDHFKGFQGRDQTAPLVLVDIDSNSIFFDPELNTLFEQTISEPSKEMKEAYLEVNPALSKSFSFPKKMKVEYSARPRNDYEKNAEEKKRLLKEYEQKIENNTSKWPNYNVTPSHVKLLHLLTNYIRSFAIDRDCHHELPRLQREAKLEFARQHLLLKHPDRAKLVEVVVGSQLYADYLDQLDKGLQTQGFH